MKKFWIKKGLMFLTFFIGAVLFFGFIVMSLWTVVLGVKAISFIQALGILLLSKILFGGFGGRGCKGNPAWKQKMKLRFDNMTPEEREKFKSEWKNRCGGRWNRSENTEEASTSSSK